MEIKNVIICGLGALGLTYANKLNNFCNLKILADEKRILKYKNVPPLFNNREIDLEYITPDDDFKADLIIISTKFNGLNSALEYIKNFILPNTIIISLINGISSEEIIQEFYPKTTVLRSYFIGHSAIRENNMVKQDGIGKIVFEPNQKLEEFFKKTNIDYEISENILYSQWIKLGVNVVLNQLSAIYECNIGELRQKEDFNYLAKNLLAEVKNIARSSSVKNLENYESDVFDSIGLIADDGFTSMYQDIKSKRKTELELFSGEIINRGKLYKIPTPFNQKIYEEIKAKEELNKT